MESMLSQLEAEVNNLFSDQYLDLLAKETGFIKRKRKISAKSFLMSFLTSYLQTENNSLTDITQTLTNCDTVVTKQSISKKFNALGERFLRRVLTTSVRRLTDLSNTKLSRYPCINALKTPDSSEIKLNKALEDIYPHVRKQGAAVKLQATINTLSQHVERLEIRPSNETDHGYIEHLKCINPGDLWVGDLGYFRIDSFKKIEASGAFYLSRYRTDTHLYDQASGDRIDLIKLLKETNTNKIELPILLSKQKIPCRCIGLRLTKPAYKKRLKIIAEKDRKHGKKYKYKRNELAYWTIFITNLPPTIRSANDFMTLYAMRWQIELFFKVTKQVMKIRRPNVKNRYRAMMSIYSSLIAVTLLCAVVMTITNREISLYKAAKTFLLGICDFFSSVMNNDQKKMGKLRDKIYRFSQKESRKNRLSTRGQLEAPHA